MSLTPSKQPLAQLFAAAKQRGGMGGALLLAGMAGIGKKHLAEWLASLYLCAEPTESGPCGRCSDCRSISAGSHPDYHMILPHETPGGSGDAAVAKATELIAQKRGQRRSDPLFPLPAEGDAYYAATLRHVHHIVNVTPWSAHGRRVIVLADADAMQGREEVQNGLLKILEEPPQGTLFVITASKPAALLETVRSRCMPFVVPAMSADEVAEVLKDGGRPNEEAARMANGSVRRALDLSDDSGEALGIAMRILEASARRDMPTQLATAAGMGHSAASGRTYRSALAVLASWIELAAGSSQEDAARRTRDSVAAWSGQVLGYPNWERAVRAVAVALERVDVMAPSLAAIQFMTDLEGALAYVPPLQQAKSRALAALATPRQHPTRTL